MKTLIPILFIVTIISCETAKEKEPTFTQLSPAETLIWIESNIDLVLEKQVYPASNGMQLPYRIFTPNDSIQRKLPLVIFLHGRGDRGTNNDRKTFERVGLFMNEFSLVAPNMQRQFPCYVLIPQCSDKTVNEEWAKWEGNTPETPFNGLGKDGSYVMHEQPSESGEATLALIDQIIRTKNIDADRVYLIGLSMGGFGTWEFTARRPDLFAAAVPMAGYSDPHQVERIKNIPFWIFHGDADKSNPVEGSRTMYRLLKEAGAKVKYTEYEGAEHSEAFKIAFKEPELIPWIFSHVKKSS